MQISNHYYRFIYIIRSQYTTQKQKILILTEYKSVSNKETAMSMSPQ